MYRLLVVACLVAAATALPISGEEWQPEDVGTNETVHFVVLLKQKNLAALTQRFRVWYAATNASH